MSIKERLLRIGIKTIKYLLNMCGRDRGNMIAISIIEEITPQIEVDTKYGKLKLLCPGRLAEWRARTFLTKEPETISWINSFDKNDVLWDVGANVGTYSLYAGLRSTRVLSFEPSSSNYHLLCKNIEMNELDDNIFALCMAFNDVTKIDSFYLVNTEYGGALNNFSEPVGWDGNKFMQSMKQGMLGYSVDEFIDKFNPIFPNHIKIDVDGIENKIITGAEKTINDPRLKSLLIELDSNRYDSGDYIIDMILNAGFELQIKTHNPITGSGSYASFYNYIYVKNFHVHI